VVRAKESIPRSHGPLSLLGPTGECARGHPSSCSTDRIARGNPRLTDNHAAHGAQTSAGDSRQGPQPGGGLHRPGRSDRAVPLATAHRAFLIGRKAARCTDKTLEHYTYTVGGFVAWLDWLVREGDLETSPMARVDMPRLAKRVLPPFTPKEAQALLTRCDRKTAIGMRNYAIVLTLMDTGLRASELVSLGIGDMDMRSGLVSVLGRGQMQRTVRAGNKARAAIVRMLAFREEVRDGAPLWVAYDIKRREVGALSVHGLQTVHRFRRTLALSMLRDGCDLHALRLLMGHSSLPVLQRYLALAGEDRASPRGSQSGGQIA